MLSEEDQIVNASLQSNLNSTSAKLVDFDTDAQFKSTIYGMNLAITWPTSSESGGIPVRVAFQGDWVRSIIVHDMWHRLLCSSGGNLKNHVLSANGITRLENVVWNDLRESLVLQQLRNASKLVGGNLSVRISHYFFVTSDEQGNYTIGNVIGTIGVAKPGEPLNFGGERIMSFHNLPFVNISLSPNDSCNQSVEEGTPYYWANKAPFQTKKLGDRCILSVDLANALSMDLNAELRNIGQLHFAVLFPSMYCVEIIGEKIDYLQEGFLTHKSGIVDLTLQRDQFERLSSSKLLLVRLENNSTQSASYEVCEIFPSLKRSDYVQCLLEELEIFVRPLDYYVFRLQRNFTESVRVEFYVTEFGKRVGNMKVQLTRIPNIRMYKYKLSPLPEDGVSPDTYENWTNNDGIATFTFSITEKIPFPRQSFYNDNQTLIVDVDGQIYRFLYNATIMDSCPFDFTSLDSCPFNFTSLGNVAMCSNALTFLAFTDPSQYNYTKPYTWVDHIQPIFEQYYGLYPVMSNILNLSNYTDVTLPYNIDLLRLALTQDFMAPGYMPVTRDLSPFKQQVILEWLGTPHYNATSGMPVVTRPVCQSEDQTEDRIPDIHLCPAIRSFNEPPTYPDNYYDQITQVDTTNPLAQWQRDAINGNCSINSLREQVQQAVELELATIPLYLTSLYSIIDGCNQEAYEIIRSVIMQEMLHLVQAANILIALGQTPVIDSNKTAPVYPHVGLPGNVLPQLNVTLKKASREHIREVFMGIEYPHVTEVAMPAVITYSTIGQFYQQMNTCMVSLTEQGETIFMENTKQLHWPWEHNLYGTVHQVNDLSSAQDAINEIIEQGEGTSPIDPLDAQPNGQLAHFYRFEEIVWGRFLVEVNGSYAFQGAPINFTSKGVWPMRDNPGKDGIEKGSRGYVEARAFHANYRALLRKLQAVFDGHPELINQTIPLMESLQVKAKKLMQIPLHSNRNETVGPVFDYIWDD